MDRSYEVQGAVSQRVEDLGFGVIAVMFAALLTLGLSAAVVRRFRNRCWDALCPWGTSRVRRAPLRRTSVRPR